MEEKDAQELVRQLDEHMEWRAAGVLPKHFEANGLAEEAHLAFQLACRPRTVDDPIKSFLSIRCQRPA